MTKFRALALLLSGLTLICVSSAAQNIVVENGQAYKFHTVLKGEGLYRLSTSYGVDQEDIISANPVIKEKGLVEGITIKIPVKQTPATYTVKKGDTAYSIATRHGLTVAQLLELNPQIVSGVREGQTLKLKQTAAADTATPKASDTSYTTYVIKKGDTSYGIAQKFGISLPKLLELNPSMTAGAVAGDTIKIPYSAESSYVTHVIAQGETLYSIGVKYGVKAQQIIDANKSLNPTELPVGSAIRIPQSSIPDEDDAFFYHRMTAGETLYKLCINYNILQDKIIASNPGVDWNALSIGQVIAIPKQQQKKTVYEDYTVGRGETLYSIASSQGVSVDDILAANTGLSASSLQKGITIRIPHTVSTDASIPATNDPTYVGDSSQQGQWNLGYDYKAEGSPAINVFLLLPFNAYSEMRDLATSSFNPAKDSYNFKSRRYVEFYEGVRMALDSLSEAGANISLKVFDTNNRLDAINQLSQSATKPDLIIGPAHKDEMADVMAYSQRMKVPVVLPFAQCDSTILDNPYVFQASVIDSITGREIYRHMASRLTGHNIILITANTRSAADKKKAAQLKSLLTSKGLSYTEHNYNTSTPTAILQLLREDATNVVIIPTNNEARANSVLTSLAGVMNQKPTAQIELWATSDWLSFQTIEVDVFHKLNTHIFTTFAVDESDPQVHYALNKYRRAYSTEPIAFTPYFQRLKPMSGFSEYGLWGYDVAFNFVGARIALGPDFARRLPRFRPALLQSNFHFKSLTNWGGAVNIGLKMLTFSPDGSIDVQSLD